MAILCFCPPDNVVPRSPTTVLYLFGKDSINSCALANLLAANIYKLFEIFNLNELNLKITANLI